MENDFTSRLSEISSGPQLLERRQIGFGVRCPLYYQPENIFIDGNPWIKKPSFLLSQIEGLIDPPDCCCLQDDDPYYAFIPAKDLQDSPGKPSLSFIHITKDSNNVVFYHTQTTSGKPQHRLAFTYGSKRYNFPITDYRYETLVAQSANDDNQIFDDCYITIGLGEKFSPYNTNLELHYRFIVGIIPTLGF